MEESSLFKLKDGRYFLSQEQSDIYSKIVKAQPHYSSQYKWDEMSMADLFADCYKHNTLYCPEMKSWYIYDGTIWIEDTGAITVNDRLKEFIRLLQIYSCEISDGETVKASDYQKFVRSLVDRRVRDRIIKDAQSEACVYLSQFDANPYLINCENGTYDLEHNAFHFHKASDYLTLKTSCNYILPNMEETYKCDRFFSFLNEIMQNDQEKLDYLQRGLGYSLFGILSEECMFFAHGKTSRNGKGTLFNTIQTVLGDYATTADSQLICRGKRNDVNNASPAIMALKGKRLVILSEVYEDNELDEKIVKSYTGNDSISARALYGKQTNLRLQCTFWLMCNHLPKVQDKTLFSSDRIKIVEFNKHFSDIERDTTLKQQFSTPEAKSVILMWLIEGYKKYVKYKLVEPESVKKAIKKYEYKNDLVKLFLEECCIEDENEKILRTLLYENFESWRKKGDYEYMSKQRFYTHVDDLYESKNHNGYIYYKGLKIR